MRARLENADRTFVAEVVVPNGTECIRYGERTFVPASGDVDPAIFEAVEVFVAPVEGALVVEP